MGSVIMKQLKDKEIKSSIRRYIFMLLLLILFAIPFTLLRDDKKDNKDNSNSNRCTTNSNCRLWYSKLDGVS